MSSSAWEAIEHATIDSHAEKDVMETNKASLNSVEIGSAKIAMRSRLCHIGSDITHVGSQLWTS